MLVKIVALFASFIMLFVNLFSTQPSLVESGDVLIEEKPVANELRTYDELNGAAGSKFYIERPKADALKVVNGSDFGMDAEKEDNYEAFKAALDYCKSNSGTYLKLNEGIYKINNKETFNLQGLKDILIDGCGATLIFSNVVGCFNITESDCIEIRNLKFDWDWDSKPLSDIVTVANADSENNELDLVFRDREADENTIFAALTQCDSETFTYGAKRGTKEDYIYQHPECIVSVTKTDKNTLHIKHNGSFSKYADGEVYILRHYVYDKIFMRIASSKNVTVDGVSLYGYPGQGFIINNKTSHFQVINSFIGTNPEYNETRHTSLCADVFFIENTGGCFNIANNDISGQGDDALNVHDGLVTVDEVNGNEIRLTGNVMLIETGDALCFCDEKFNKTGVTATVTDKKAINGGHYQLVLDKNLDGIVGENYIAFDTAYNSGNYIIRNNYIHENRARGFLLQASNGLCENNTFYKIDVQAIKITMDISYLICYEGTGVDRLVIRNNKFEQCTYGRGGEVICIDTGIYGETATSQPYTNIEITGNTFVDFPQYVLRANNVNGLVFTDNTVDTGSTFKRETIRGKTWFGQYCSNITFENNDYTPNIKQIAKSEKFRTWAEINSQLL